MESNDRFMKNMATKMFGKFEKYWSEFSTIMAISVVFDPRYKFQLVDWAFKKIYGSSADVELELFKGKLFALFDEYSASSAHIGNQSQRCASVNVAATTGDQASDSYMMVIFNCCFITLAFCPKLAVFLNKTCLFFLFVFNLVVFFIICYLGL